MNNIFRTAALAAAIVGIGLVNPATAKPKHEQGYHAHSGQAYQPGNYKHRHAHRYYRGPEHPYSGTSMAPPGWAGYAPWYGGDRPPGWNHGVKRGWHGRSMPPGQYKKYDR